MDEKQIRKDEYYISIAEAISRKSTCLRRAYGAIIVRNDEIISTGYNGSPRGCINCAETGCMRQAIGIGKGDAYNLCVSVHAEQNAIISAKRSDMIGATIYIVGLNMIPELAAKSIYADPSPCLLCHRMIINAGIVRCVGMVSTDEHPEGIVQEIDVSVSHFSDRMRAEYDKHLSKMREETNILQRTIDKLVPGTDDEEKARSIMLKEQIENAETMLRKHTDVMLEKYGTCSLTSADTDFKTVQKCCDTREDGDPFIFKKPMCMYYSKVPRSDGLHWGHYPDCEPANCPKLHPELLDEAKGV